MDFNKFSEKSVPNFYSELSTVNPRTDDCSNILDFPGVRGLKFAGAAGVTKVRVRVENTSIEEKGARPGESITPKNIYPPLESPQLIKWTKADAFPSEATDYYFRRKKLSKATSHRRREG